MSESNAATTTTEVKQIEKAYKLSISGSRTVTDYALFEGKLLSYIKEYHGDQLPVQIIHGGAQGIDRMADKFARTRRIAVRSLRPRYDLYPPSKAYKACLDRNIDIVKAGDYLVAFPKGIASGTKHAITEAQKINKPVCVVDM